MRTSRATASPAPRAAGYLVSLGILVLLASLYSLYLLYLGLPVLMKSPKEKAAGYTVVVVLCAIVLNVVLGATAD